MLTMSVTKSGTCVRTYHRTYDIEAIKAKCYTFFFFNNIFMMDSNKCLSENQLFMFVY